MEEGTKRVIVAVAVAIIIAYMFIDMGHAYLQKDIDGDNFCHRISNSIPKNVVPPLSQQFAALQYSCVYNVTTHQYVYNKEVLW